MVNSASRYVYLDNCALNRPFDDQSQIRIRMESDAIHLILDAIRTGTIRLAVSPVHFLEVTANPDPARREHVEHLLHQYGQRSNADLSAVRKRAEQLHSRGMGVADAAHMAFAEAAHNDFVTVDDQLLRQCARMRVTIWYGTPMAYCEKEDLR